MLNISVDNASTSVRVRASTLSLNRGSVLDARKLNHAPPSRSTVTPSRRSIPVVRSANASSTAWVRSAASSTVELISPDALYVSYEAIISESGRSWAPRAARTCSAASMPESAPQKSRK